MRDRRRDPTAAPALTPVQPLFGFVLTIRRAVAHFVALCCNSVHHKRRRASLARSALAAGLSKNSSHAGGERGTSPYVRGRCATEDANAQRGRNEARFSVENRRGVL